MISIGGATERQLVTSTTRKDPIKYLKILFKVSVSNISGQQTKK